MQGLSTDTGLIRALARDEGATMRFHTPVTGAEAKELDRRSAVADYGAKIVDREIAKADSTFAGGAMETSTGVLTLAYTEELSETKRSEVKATAPPGTTIEFVRGDRSLTDLLALQDRIHNLKGELARRGVRLSGSSIGQMEGTVRLYVDASAGLDAAKRATGDALGVDTLPEVELVSDAGTEDQISRNLTSGRVYGGIWLSFDNGGDCTSSIANVESGSKPGQFYIVTAGHCSLVGDHAYMGANKETYLAGVVKNFDDGYSTRNCDCLIIGPFSASSPRVSSNALVNNNAIHDYVAVGRNEASYFRGRTVCHSGAASFEYWGSITCSTIYDTFARKTTARGTQLQNMILMDSTTTRGGDSGGPWGDGGNFLGVHQGALGPASIFSRSSYLTDLNVYTRWGYSW